mgnify:CR=1 FL=1
MDKEDRKAVTQLSIMAVSLVIITGAILLSGG